jgi:hypothetical protein
MFDADGDINKSKLSQGYAAHYEKGNEVIWRISHRTKGVNKLSIKMDTRLTVIRSSENLENTEAEGTFILDTDDNSYFSMLSFRESNLTESLLLGDNTGFVYKAYTSSSNTVLFDYETNALDMGMPENNKRFKRVIVWIEKLTPNDLTLFYWCDYRIRMEYQSKVKVSMAPTKGTQPALWDIALWDQAFWDDYTPDIGIIEFNLHSYQNNAEGVSLKLKFEQLESGSPVRIHGFAIDWEDLGSLQIPTGQVA